MFGGVNWRFSLSGSKTQWAYPLLLRIYLQALKIFLPLHVLVNFHSVKKGTLRKWPAFAWNIRASFPETMWLKVITEISWCDLKYSHKNSLYKCHLFNEKAGTDSAINYHTQEKKKVTKPAVAFKLKLSIKLYTQTSNKYTQRNIFS